MKYEKPEVVLLASAIRAIHGGRSKGASANDCGADHTAGSAYEADE